MIWITKSLKITTKVFLSLIIFLTILHPSASAATYYVDPDVTDTNPTSATPDFTTYNHTTYETSGGTDSVYKTIADVNLKSFSAGDTVSFKEGELWREQLNIPSDTEFSFIFEDEATGEIIQPFPKETSASIYSTEIPVQFINTEASIKSGTLTIKVW